MAEEKIDESTPTSDDMSVLRVLMHNVQGISPVSTAVNYTASDDDLTV